jgi:L-erythro-3,5-diaminohexanoate dehydrogenase
VALASPESVGADRVLEPAGGLPQAADRLDADAPMRPHEIEVAVEGLWLDSTSLRNLRERSGADPGAMADRIGEIVAARGKMHNPESDSGGVLVGTVAAAGEDYDEPPDPGERIVTLASLTLTPLRLDAVRPTDPESPLVEVAGTAYVSGRAGWATVPDDMPLTTAISLLDVCAAASAVHELAQGSETVVVLGAGHAGQLVMAAARDVMDEGMVVAVDVDDAAVERAMAYGLCDAAVVADLQDPLGSAAALAAAGVPPADLTVAVVNAPRCEPAALLLTADSGTVLLFSMATSFAAAALAADGLSSTARLMIGSGHSPDRGAYALDLARRSEPLRRALGLPTGGPA